MKPALIIFALLTVFAGVATVHAEGTDNHILNAVPTPGRVVIDGNLNDWDQSGRIPVCSDVTQFNQFSAWISMMYDGDALYVGVDCNDPTPMVNDYNPDFDIDRRKCFHSDSLQIHFHTDQIRNVIGWYYTKEKRPGVIALDGLTPWSNNPIVYIDGLRELGITEAFAMKADGKGYTQEMRIPWRAIVKSGNAYKAGESFAAMLDMVWGPDNGKGWPVNHMMDLVAPGAVHTGWFWEVREIYGKVTLSPTGNLKLPPPEFSKTASASDRPKIAGTIPLQVELPKGEISRFALGINDEAGNRVRSLPGDCRPGDYAMSANPGEVEVLWDGLDDRGKPVAPGKYQVIGLTRGDITPVYDMCFYNPGTPPWTTADGTGAWGADHSPPTDVAAAGDSIVIGWAGAEGGSGIIGLGVDGHKLWGQQQGVAAMSADDRFVWFMLNDFWAGKHGLARLARKDGSYQPFNFNGKPQLPVSLEEIFGGKPPGVIRGMAVHDGKLVLSMSEGKIALLDADSAKLIKSFDVKNPGGLAFSQSGALYALVAGRLCSIDLANGNQTAIDTPGVVRATAIAVFHDGNIAIADMGPDSQVKVFSPAGKLQYTAGKTGGRPLSGPFDPQAMSHVSSIAFDSKGQLWAVESWENPRRVSVWGKDGKLVRDYVGNTAYSACGTFLHDQDPTLAYSGPVEMKLDRAHHQSKVSQILWVPDFARGQRFEITGGLPQPQRFTSSASGKPHEYLFNHAWDMSTGYTVYMERPDGWKPVAAICLVGHVSGGIDRGGKVREEPAGEFSGLNAYDGCYWNDANGDGIPQRNECIIVPAKKPAAKGQSGQSPLSLQNGWGGRMGADMSIYSDGIVKYAATFADDGAPKYSPAGTDKLPVADRGDLIPLDDCKTLLCLSSTGYGQTSYVRGLEIGSWRELWRYPSFSQGVHGSHHASMPEPGRIIGANKICGAARINDEVGDVFDIRGNLGEDFLMTADGLYVGAIFRDSRLPGPSLPPCEQDLFGKSIADLTEGGEPFNGWFGKQTDGKIRMLTGIPGQAGMIAEIKGLDTIHRFIGPKIEVSPAQLVAADEANAARAVAHAAPKQYTIQHHTISSKPDDSVRDWAAIPAIDISRQGSPQHAQAKLAYDEQFLYVHFDVADPSPWRNAGKDFARLFKTGDAVDLQFSTAADAAAPSAPGPSHQRLLIAPFDGKPACVLMKPVDPQAPANLSYTYHSPVGDKHFDRVESLADVKISVKVEANRYRVDAAIPLANIGLKPAAGMTIHGDVGFISSDADGLIDSARTYWSNEATNLTNDLPSEAWLYPATWGEFKFD